jgi:hypothetical protein
MSNRAFEVGDHVRLVENIFRHEEANATSAIGIVRSVDKNRRRTEPYYIYYVEMPGESKLVDFEYREIELVSPAADELKVQ